MSALQNQAALTGAPGVLKLGDLELLVTKPSAQDLVAMQRWVLSQPLANEPQGISSAELAGLSDSDRVIVLREYAKAAKSKRMPTDAEIMLLVTSPAGVARQVWNAARRHQPSLKIEDIARLVTDANADQVSEALDVALGVDPEGEGSSDPKAPAGPG